MTDLGRSRFGLSMV